MIMLKQKVRADDDSKKNHPALKQTDHAIEAWQTPVLNRHDLPPEGHMDLEAPISQAHGNHNQQCRAAQCQSHNR
jgi:hypothetical protein